MRKKSAISYPREYPRMKIYYETRRHDTYRVCQIYTKQSRKCLNSKKSGSDNWAERSLGWLDLYILRETDLLIFDMLREERPHIEHRHRARHTDDHIYMVRFMIFFDVFREYLDL
jgi:hypothetical protein